MGEKMSYFDKHEENVNVQHAKTKVHVHTSFHLLAAADTLKDSSSFGAEGNDEERYK